MMSPTSKLLAVAVCWLSMAAASSSHARRPSWRQQGESLFKGRLPLLGKIRGHQDSLPPEVVVCAHCHTRRAPEAGSIAAPIINRTLLLEPRPRRGGPPSAYDVSFFCRLLRTGADPAYVLIDRVMPVYDLSDAACTNLWEYLAK